jgi:hypothetical protein
LIACGGGSNGGSVGGSNTLTFRYESLSVDAGNVGTFLTQINAEGAKGYRYWPNGGASVDFTPVSTTFVNDGTASSYTYEILAEPGDVPGLLAQANTEGAKGYRYEGSIELVSLSGAPGYSLYRKDGGVSATYTYAADPAPTNTVDFLAQANGRGQSGYRFANLNVPPSFAGWDLYIKDDASSAIYTYDAPAAPASLADLLTQFNDEGAKGYRVMGDLSFEGESAWVYVKDQTQSATFVSLFDPTATRPSLDQLSNYGAQGYAYLGQIQLYLPSGSAAGGATSVSTGAPLPLPVSALTGGFFKASNCSGLLCTDIQPNPPVQS